MSSIIFTFKESTNLKRIMNSITLSCILLTIQGHQYKFFCTLRLKRILAKKKSKF